MEIIASYQSKDGQSISLEKHGGTYRIIRVVDGDEVLVNEFQLRNNALTYLAGYLAGTGEYEAFKPI